MGTSWLVGFDPGGFAYRANQGQRKNVPLFLDVVDVGIGGVSPLEVKSVLLQDFVEFFRPGDVSVRPIVQPFAGSGLFGVDPKVTTFPSAVPDLNWASSFLEFYKCGGCVCSHTFCDEF